MRLVSSGIRTKSVETETGSIANEVQSMEETDERLLHYENINVIITPLNNMDAE